METIRIDIINPKAKNLLKDLADLNLIKISKEKKIFVLSGSNQKELKKIFMKKNIIKCFDNIYGSPKNKEDAI